MTSKKFLKPIILLIVVMFAMVAYSLITNIAKKPMITEKEFEFSITYELNGKKVTIEDVYFARYVGNGGYTDSKSCIYVGKIGGLEEEGTTEYVLKEEGNTRIVLYTNFYANYMMGDPEGDYFSDEPFEPQIMYYDEMETEYIDEETLLEQGVKLISWEYPTPIENTFVFSHISYFNGEIVFPTFLISLVALLVTVIFVKKEKDLEPKHLDAVSTICNFLLGIFVAPFFALTSWLSDITGDNEYLSHQMLYFTSALTILGIATSVYLRRKGFSKSGLIVQFVGPAVFILILFFNMIGAF